METGRLKQADKLKGNWFHQIALYIDTPHQLNLLLQDQVNDTSLSNFWAR